MTHKPYVVERSHFGATCEIATFETFPEALEYAEAVRIKYGGAPFSPTVYNSDGLDIDTNGLSDEEQEALEEMGL